MRSQHNPAFDSILEGGPLPLYVPSNDGLPGPFPDFDLYYSSTNTTFIDPFTMLKPTTTLFGHGPSEEHLKSLLLGQDLGQRVKGPQAVPSLSSSGPFGLGSSNATSDVEHLNDPAMQALYTYEADVADMIASDKLCHRAEDALRNRQAQWHNRKPAYSPAQILLDSFKRGPVLPEERVGSPLPDTIDPKALWNFMPSLPFGVNAGELAVEEVPTRATTPEPIVIPHLSWSSPSTEASLSPYSPFSSPPTNANSTFTSPLAHSPGGLCLPTPSPTHLSVIDDSDDEHDEYLPTTSQRKRQKRTFPPTSTSTPRTPKSTGKASHDRSRRPKRVKTNLQVVLEDLPYTMDDIRVENKEYYCPFPDCSQKTTSEGDLGRHLESSLHATHKYVCLAARCLKPFAREDSLQRHHGNGKGRPCAAEHERLNRMGFSYRVKKEDMKHLAERVTQLAEQEGRITSKQSKN